MRPDLRPDLATIARAKTKGGESDPMFTGLWLEPKIRDGWCVYESVPATVSRRSPPTFPRTTTWEASEERSSGIAHRPLASRRGLGSRRLALEARSSLHKPCAGVGRRGDDHRLELKY